jgi:hypothetical protein
MTLAVGRRRQTDQRTSGELFFAITDEANAVKHLSRPILKIEFEYDGQTYTSGKNVFHIINDRNNRNIIEGETFD